MREPAPELAAGAPPEHPLWSAGLRAGETILMVDGVSVAGADLGSVVKQIAGQAGTKVRLQVVGADGQARLVEVARGRIAIGAKGESDFAGSFRFQDKPAQQLEIVKTGEGRYRIDCKAENWSGMGVLYRNVAFDSYHLKGVYQVDSSPDVPGNQRGVVGYLRIDCATSGVLEMKRAWNLAGDKADEVSSTVLLRKDADAGRGQ